MKKPILISGIQPTGRLHLGNYLGALKNFVELQNSGRYQCYFFIADYHSITEDFDAKEKMGQILDLTANYLAAGLDPKKSVIFLQSDVPECTELAWILSTVAPLGEMERMTQFKDKSKHQPENVNMGLFSYPILMTADILLYDAVYIPIGKDQQQHLELARTLARKFNNKFGQTFIEPQAVFTKTSRLLSLNNIDKKMSKSQPEGCLFLDDSPEEIKKKISRAVTDSGSEIKYDTENKAGVSNLLEIYSALSEKSIPELEKKYIGKGYGQFKSDLAEVATKALASFRELKTSNLKLKTMLSAGGKKADKIASAKMKEVKKKLGLF